MKGEKKPRKEYYPKVSYRIDNDVKNSLRNIKFDTGLSYNLIFHELINIYEEEKRARIRGKENRETCQESENILYSENEKKD